MIIFYQGGSEPIQGLRFIVPLSPGADSRMNRQTLQHYLWKDEIGYLLHPSISTDVENLKVAEIGVGTGCEVFIQAQENGD